MHGNSSQEGRNAAAVSGRPLTAGRKDALAELNLDEFRVSFREKPVTWLLAKAGIRKRPSDDEDDDLTEGEMAERSLLVRKALERIHKAGFYTLDALRQLAVKHYKEKAEAFSRVDEEARNALRPDRRLTPEQRSELIGKRHAALKAIRQSKEAEQIFDNRGLTYKLERLMEGKRRAYGLPKKKTVNYLFFFLRETGFLESPAPVRLLLRDKLLTTVMVNTVKEIQDDAARKAPKGVAVEDERNHFFYHAVRSEIGGRGVRLRYELLEQADKALDLIPGAVYTTYIYDEPYLKKGVFVIYPRRPIDPARVKFLTRWESPVSRPIKASESAAPLKATHNQSSPLRGGAFVEEQKGYIFEQGFDFYIYLFGPDEYNSPPSSERTRRISTIYVDGNSRSGAVMNKIMGSIIAFDSGPKGEIMFQRVVMYRHGEEFRELDPERMDQFVERVLAESRRFDINEPLELTREEHAYREIFMDLGFEATEVKDPDDDRPRLEVRRIVQPISDQSPMEIIFDR